MAYKTNSQYVENIGSQKKVLGKVVPTLGGAHNRFKSYEFLTFVYDEDTLVAYISKKNVPEEVPLTNREYWQPMNVSGYQDDNIIILTDKNESGQIIPYTLEEAIASIAEVARKPGAILSFFNLQGGSHWEIWQYNNVNVYEWENVEHWRALYNVYNKFIGWYNTLDELFKVYIGEYEGKYAIVGDTIRTSAIYEGRADGWYKLDINIYQKAFNDIINCIEDGTLNLTIEQRDKLKAFILGTDTDECAGMSCDGDSMANKMYTKFRIRTDIEDSEFGIQFRHPTSPFAFPNIVENLPSPTIASFQQGSWNASDLLDLDFKFVSGTFFQRTNKGEVVEADENPYPFYCLGIYFGAATAEQLAEIKMSVDKGREYVINDPNNPWYRTYEITGEDPVTGVFIPCDGKNHFIAFSRRYKDEEDSDMYNMRFVIDNTTTSNVELKLKYYRENENPASCYTTHRYMNFELLPNDYYENMTEEEKMDYENTAVNQYTNTDIVGCFNSRLPDEQFEFEVKSGEGTVHVLRKITYEGNEEWCDAAGLVPGEGVRGFIIVRVI